MPRKNKINIKNCIITGTIMALNFIVFVCLVNILLIVLLNFD